MAPRLLWLQAGTRGQAELLLKGQDKVKELKFGRMLRAAVAFVLVGALAACGGGGGSEESLRTDETIVFKLAFNQTEQHPQYLAGVEFGKLLEEATDGRYAVDVYPNDQLGGQQDAVQNLRDGSIELMWIGGALMESFNTDFGVFNQPYIFASPEAQTAVLSDERLVGDLYDSLADSHEITVLTGVFAGVRNIYNSSHPIRTPEDMNGLKIRIQQSDSQVRMIEGMGGIPSPMAFSEIYSALQTGVLDGAENNETVFNAMKHDEVAKYYSYTRHLIIPDYLLMSTRVLEGMSEEDQETLLELMPQVRDVANDFDAFVEESLEKSEATGAQFNDDVDIDAFRERLRPMLEEAVSENEVRKALFAGVEKANRQHPAK